LGISILTDEEWALIERSEGLCHFFFGIAIGFGVAFGVKEPIFRG